LVFFNKIFFGHFHKIGWEFLSGFLVEPIIRLIKVILVASTLTYLPSSEVASSKLYNLYQAIRSYSGSHHLVSELWLLIQVLSYPIIFLCNLSRFVFCPYSVICFLVYVLLRCCLCLCFVLVLVLVMFLFLFLFLVSFRLCVKKKSVWVLFQVKKKVSEIWKKREENKKEKKRKEKKVGCLIFEHKIEEVRGFFLAENRVPNPLI